MELWEGQGMSARREKGTPGEGEMGGSGGPPGEKGIRECQRKGV